MTISREDRLRGAFFGLPIGDALGTTIEFKERDTYEHVTGMTGGGPFRLNPGEWTDDTSMMLALAATLKDHGPNSIELLKNFTRWYRKGEFSHNGRCFDIGTTTRTALDKFVKSRGTDDSPASTDHFDSGNGGIMRMAPVVVYARSLRECEDLARWQSRATHASSVCKAVAGKLARVLWKLSEDGEMDPSDGYFYQRTPRDQIKSTGYVEDTYHAAMWAVYQTDNFKDAVLLAVNLGDDADTVGAVTGQIAGAKYGYNAIPEEWLDVLAWHTEIEGYFECLMARWNS